MRIISWQGVAGVAAIVAASVLSSSAASAADGTSATDGAGKFSTYCDARGTSSPTEPAPAEVCFGDLPSLLNYLSGGKISLTAARTSVKDAADEFALIEHAASLHQIYTTAYLYPNASYGGTLRTQTASGNCTSTTSWYYASLGTYNNIVTSLKPGSACNKVTLWMDQNYGGPQQTYSGNTPNVGAGMNDQAESLRAYKG